MKSDIATNFRLVFFFLFLPLPQSLKPKVTHLSFVLKNLGDFSRAKNKSVFLSMELPGAETLGSRISLWREPGRMAPTEPKEEGQLAYSAL